MHGGVGFWILRRFDITDIPTRRRITITPELNLGDPRFEVLLYLSNFLPKGDVVERWIRLFNAFGKGSD